MHRATMIAIVRDVLTGDSIQHLRITIATHGDTPTIRGPGNGIPWSRYASCASLATNREHALSSCHLPLLHSAIVAGGSDAGLVRRPGNGKDSVRMPSIGEDVLTCARVPYLHSRIQATRSNIVSIRRPGDS